MNIELSLIDQQVQGVKTKLNLFHPKSQDNLKINLISFKIHNLMLRFQLNFYNYHC